MRRKEVIDNKLKKAAKLSKKEKEILKVLDEFEIENLDFEVRMTQIKYFHHVQNVCQYLLDSCTPVFDVPDELKEEADSIEEDIFMDLKDIRSKIINKYVRG